MMQRPYIRQGTALSAELRSSTKYWRQVQTFLNDLRDNGTKSKQETHRANHVTLLAEIDAVTREILQQTKGR